MKKKIDVMLCICFLIGTVLGCGGEINLIEDSSDATFEGSSEPEIADVAESDNEQQKVEQTEETEKPDSVQIQKITVPKKDYLLAEVPELWDIAHYIQQKTGGQAVFQVYLIQEPDHQVTYQGKVLPRYYDCYYANVVWPDHEEEGIEFYVGKYEGQILCREDDEEKLYTLEEWRTTDGYAARMAAVVEWQQEKTKILLASEGESLDEPWYEAYKNIIMDWTIIEDFEDRGGIDYLKYACADYYDFCYEFYLYWLCDMDRNGTPELFFWYPDTGLGDIMMIMTYTDHPIVVDGTPIFMEMIYGINVETSEIIIKEHWTGAGGTGEYEWSGRRMQGDALEFCFYIDSWAEFEEYTSTSDTPYFVDYPERHVREAQADGREYEEIYENHVANCIPVEDFVMYDMMDLSGLKDIQ